MKILIKVYKSAAKYWTYIAFSAVVMLILTGINLITPRLTQNMVRILEDNMKTEGDVNRLLNDIIYIAVFLLIVFLVRTVMQFLQSYVSHYAAWKFLAEIRA
ncbi:MAG: hypothetical protein FWH10_02835, partial [Oscillospiraceae bacterium]|nr:hypothetical protein [Oscillospiraceae bacterium]